MEVVNTCVLASLADSVTMGRAFYPLGLGVPVKPMRTQMRVGPSPLSFIISLKALSA